MFYYRSQTCRGGHHHQSQWSRSTQRKESYCCRITLNNGQEARGIPEHTEAIVIGEYHLGVMSRGSESVDSCPSIVYVVDGKTPPDCW